MATNTAGSVARQDPRNVTNTIRVSLQSGASAAAAAGSGIQIGVLPQGAFITGIFSEVSTQFTGTPTFGVGTDGAQTNIIAAGAVTTVGAPIGNVTGAKIGRVHAAAADVPINIKFSAAAAAGVLDIVIEFEGGFPG